MRNKIIDYSSKKKTLLKYRQTIVSDWLELFVAEHLQNQTLSK